MPWVFLHLVSNAVKLYPLLKGLEIMAQVPQLMSTGQFGRMGLFLRGELGN